MTIDLSRRSVLRAASAVPVVAFPRRNGVAAEDWERRDAMLMSQKQLQERAWRACMLRDAMKTFLLLLDDKTAIDDEAALLDRLALVLQLVARNTLIYGAAKAEPKPMQYWVDVSASIYFHNVWVGVDGPDVDKMANAAMTNVYEAIIPVLGQSVSYSGEKVERCYPVRVGSDGSTP